MFLLYFPESLHCCVSSQSYGNCILRCWWNCAHWLSWAWQNHHRNLLHWSDLKSSGVIEGEETRKVAPRSAVLSTHTSFEELTSIWNAAFKLLNHLSHIFVFGSKYIEGIPERKRICWRWRCYHHSKWLAGRAWSTVLLQWNLSFGEILDQVQEICWKVT